jgi:hypothetical protein
MAGSFADMGILLSNIGIKGSAGGKFNDPLMLLICEHPCIALGTLEDYLMANFPEYAEMSLNEFLTKYDGQNHAFWKYYLDVSQDLPQGHPIAK